MKISAVDVHLLDLPLVEPFVAAHGTTRSRTVVVLGVTTDDGTVGWGECSALPAATYSAESAAGCHRLLADRVAPRLIGRDGPSVDSIDDAGLADHPMSRSAVEMALLDAELTRSGASLAEHLGATRPAVPAGASLGLDRTPAVVERARALIGQGYRRLKVKIEPGHDREVLGALRSDPEVGAGVEIHLDANGAYRAGDLDLLVGLAADGADALEQPLAPSEVAASAELVRRLADAGDRSDRRGGPVPVVADEAVTGAADATRLADRGAITGVSIKPGRVGGLSVAVELHDLCRARGLAATAGGMLETGLGRHALAALAALPGFTLPGDLSPAGRWLQVDPWPDLDLRDGCIDVPTGPGVAPGPDPDLLAAHTIEHRRCEAAG